MDFWDRRQILDGGAGRTLRDASNAGRIYAQIFVQNLQKVHYFLCRVVIFAKMTT
jgi:hypothetical protein